MGLSSSPKASTDSSLHHDTRSAWRRRETDSASVATPPAAGLASAAAAFRDLGGNKDHNRCGWRIVQLMKEIRGPRMMSYLFGSSTALEIIRFVWDFCSILLPVSDVSMDCKNSTKDTNVYVKVYICMYIYIYHIDQCFQIFKFLLFRKDTRIGTWRISVWAGMSAFHPNQPEEKVWREWTIHF